MENTNDRKLREETARIHRCKIFHCDRRGDRYCCFYCLGKDSCPNPCLNMPHKCGSHCVKAERHTEKED